MKSEAKSFGVEGKNFNYPRRSNTAYYERLVVVRMRVSRTTRMWKNHRILFCCEQPRENYILVCGVSGFFRGFRHLSQM